ncbi:TetR/AcrR family transcriptional regulator [Haloarchaeobius iranensis]|uniref:DNA-binding transcriptional regulator, AcrR family n=1 Tax=Haloarchaeobius iranensis TaxID=996166 RepID=A0A1G9Z9K6_9EURY|nr:TetR/AcrR family transcriptional regulator [Haloarchaeobius iranensis]SDN17316.1 DNA-binding transcriptional regulator, AcrR family [Haloarchaeobius iranensis]
MGDTSRFAAATEDDTRAAIMRATYDALTSHGYANLTIQRIGDEFEKSKSLLYHHYDGKDDLLVDFLRFMLEHWEAKAECREEQDPRARLEALLDRVAGVELDEETAAFTAAMEELRGQAPHDAAYREQFTEHDRALRERFAEIIAAGIDEGSFHNVDPARAAEFLLTTVNGVRIQRVTRDDAGGVAATRAELDEYLDARLYRGDA